MKRSILTLVVTLVVTSALAQDNLFWTMRVKVKMDKRLEWEKKAPLFMKTHYPQFVFRVYEVTTGPNTGSYVLSIGPISYKLLDSPPVYPKGEAAVRSDEQVLDAMTESTEVIHYRRVDEISQTKPDRKNKYASLNFIDINLGSWPEIQAFHAKIKQVREQNGIAGDFGFFRPVHSGAYNRFVFVRYLERLEELDMNTNIEELYDKVHGKYAFHTDREKYLSLLKSTSGELWVLRNELSTPQPVAAMAN